MGEFFKTIEDHSMTATIIAFWLLAMAGALTRKRGCKDD